MRESTQEEYAKQLGKMGCNVEWVEKLPDSEWPTSILVVHRLRLKEAAKKTATPVGVKSFQACCRCLQ